MATDSKTRDIPSLGYGTYKLNGGTYKMTLSALEEGYRHIDTATTYRHEKSVGMAIRDSKIARNEIFLTTKIPWYNIEKGTIKEAVDNSLKELDVSYIDLILLHVPYEGKNISSWKLLEEVFEEYKGKINHIGVSNYNIEQLTELLDNCSIIPYCNQIEVTPFLQRPKLINLCKVYNIKVVAHSSLTKGTKLNNETLVSVANDNKVSTAQILLKWGLEKGYVVLPRTKNQDHLREDFQLNFKINDKSMDILNSLDENYATHPKLLVGFTK